MKIKSKITDKSRISLSRKFYFTKPKVKTVKKESFKAKKIKINLAQFCWKYLSNNSKIK